MAQRNDNLDSQPAAKDLRQRDARSASRPPRGDAARADTEAEAASDRAHETRDDLLDATAERLLAPGHSEEIDG